MTQFFTFETLTWPEVAELPRDTPLVLPLGNGYDAEKVAEALSHPPKIGMLPPIPYGWPGSGIEVPEKRLGELLANLLDSLRDDGFSHVIGLAPPGVFQPNRRMFHGALISLPPRPQPVNSLPDPRQGEEPPVLVVPIGHTEQHGHHLPLNTDSLIIQAIAQKAVEIAEQPARTLPVFPYGVSTHRTAFAGTLNTGGRAFEKFWLATIDHLVWRGFDRFYLISGHGGSCSFLVNIVKYAGERHTRIFAATTWLHTSDRIGMESLKAHRRSNTGGMGHAGELETAMVLHLRPDLVHMDRCVDEIDFIATDSYFMDWAEGGVLVANPPWDDDTKTGAYGAGSLATSENGKTWLAAAAREKADHIGQIHEQQRRREARRIRGFGRWGKILAAGIDRSGTSG